ncbi:MAG TPA: zf-HC2 domain-containing protein [Bacillota bacterium]|nr:zf-HC2 domain-containing protein [Bacillota bacterium]
MNCHTVQNLISTYIDCELDAELKREVRKHLFECTECNIAYLELQRLKNCLESAEPPGVEFDSLASLYARLDEEKRTIVQRPEIILWGPRLLVAAACASLFFLSALSLFPLTNKNNSLAAEDHYYESNREVSEGTFDRNFSFDRSVTVYQASVLLP